ncbi:hypothetical protein ACLOJK_010977 [Asimina triloba]
MTGGYRLELQAGGRGRGRDEAQVYRVRAYEGVWRFGHVGAHLLSPGRTDPSYHDHAFVLLEGGYKLQDEPEAVSCMRHGDSGGGGCGCCVIE